MAETIVTVHPILAMYYNYYYRRIGSLTAVGDLPIENRQIVILDLGREGGGGGLLTGGV